MLDGAVHGDAARPADLHGRDDAGADQLVHRLAVNADDLCELRGGYVLLGHGLVLNHVFPNVHRRAQKGTEDTAKVSEE